jgi:hypothetical protein
MRKKGRFLLLLLFLPVMLWGMDIVETINFDVTKVEFYEEDGFTILRMEGADPYIVPGAPELPAVSIRLLIPPDKDVESVEILEIEEAPFLENVIVKPSHLLGVPGYIEPQFLPPDPQYYERDVYPNEIIKFGGTGNMGGYRIAAFLIFPLRYMPRDNRVTFINSITFKMNLKPSDPTLSPRRRDERAFNYWKEFVKKTVFNKNEVEIYSPPVFSERVEGSFAPKQGPQLGGSPVSYVIIVPDDYATPFYDFAEWKTKLGYPAVVRTTSWIYQNYEGADLAEKIRNFIINAYQNWGTLWFLVAGDYTDIPTRAAYVPLPVGEEYQYVTSDLYFACLDGNWNFDGDDYWAELEDSTDVFPDVFVGRAPIRSVEEAENFINKTISYKENPGGGVVEEYLTRALMWGSNQFSVGDGCDQIAQIVPSFPEYFDIAIICEDENYDPTTEEFIDSLYSGFGQVFITAHGTFNHFWTCSLPRGYFMRYNASELENFPKLSFYNILSCEPVGFNLDSWGEHLFRASGGAIGVWGTTSLNFPSTAVNYAITFYDSLFTARITEMGAVHINTIIRFSILGHFFYNYYRYLNFGYTLLGDPSLNLWIETPERYSVDIDRDHFYVGENDLKITVHSANTGGPASGVLITAYKPGEVFESQVTDLTGTAILHIEPLSQGAVELTVTSDQGVPFFFRLPVWDSLPFVSIVDYTINDFSGDMDGILDAGETAGIKLLLYNGGREQTPYLSAFLISESEFVDVSVDSIPIGFISPNDSLWTQNEFLVSASSSMPDSIRVNFNVIFVSDGSYYDSSSDIFIPPAPIDTLFIDTFSTLVRAPELIRYGQYYTQSNDTFYLHVAVRNRGGDSSRDIVGILSADSGVLFIDSIVNYGNLAPGGTIADSLAQPFSFLLSLPIDSITFYLTLYDSTGYHGTFPIIMRNPSFFTRLNYTPEIDGILLEWEQSNDPELLGYYVYRSLTPSGPFERLTPEPINISFYEDRNVSYTNAYYYRVSLVDTFYNESSPTDIVEAYTNPPFFSNWPQKVGLIPCLSPLVVDLDPGYPGLEIIVAGKFSGKITAYYSDGTMMEGWPFDMGDGNEIYGSIAAGDLDGDGELEIVAAPWGPSNQVFALERDGQQVSGWPRTVQGSSSNQGIMGIFSTPAVGDLDNDGTAEVVVKTMKGEIYVWHGDGTGLIDTSGFFFDTPDNSWSMGSPSIADVDGDDTLEIIVGTNSGSIYILKPDGSILPNFPVTLQRNGNSLSIQGAIAIADFVPTNPGEEIAVVGGSWLYLIGIDGDTLPGWPQRVSTPGDVWRYAPAAADVDSDGEIEIVVNSGTSIKVFNPNGTLLPGFPTSSTSDSPGPPVVADIDSDGKCEIFVITVNAQFTSIEWTGERSPRFPIFISGDAVSAPCISDLNSDGYMELIAGGSDDRLWIFTSTEPYDPSLLEWATFKHDPGRTGWYGAPSISQSSTKSVSTDIPKILFLSQNSPNPFRNSTTITLGIPEKTRVEVLIYDVAGRLVRKIYSGSLKPGYHRFIWDGRDSKGRKLPSGVYFYSLKTSRKRITKKALFLR